MYGQTNMRSHVSIDALSDVEGFLSAAQHLKALTLQYLQLRARQSRREHSIATQIECITELLADKARGNPRVSAMWLDTVAELQRLSAAHAEGGAYRPAAGACKGGST